MSGSARIVSDNDGFLTIELSNGKIATLFDDGSAIFDIGGCIVIREDIELFLSNEANSQLDGVCREDLEFILSEVNQRAW